MAEDDTLVPVANPPEQVRCVECRHEYDLPALGEEMGCPNCGGISWVSTRIPVAPAPAALARHEARRS
jgi:DNA-directed RNA polymerase subunit RPC12/RpoP